METLKGLFMARQDTFLERTGVGPTTLGRQAVGDPNLVRELRHGRSPTLATADQLLDLPPRAVPHPMLVTLDQETGVGARQGGRCSRQQRSLEGREAAPDA